MSDDKVEPALVASRPRVGAKQIIPVLLVLPLAYLVGHSIIASGEGGSLVCSRPENHCELQNGWLIRDRVAFATDDLEGARSERSSATFASSRNIYFVSVTTRHGSHRLGGTDNVKHAKIATAINAFAHDPQAPSLDVRVDADAGPYVITGLLGSIYGFVAVALLVGWLRTRRAWAMMGA